MIVSSQPASPEVVAAHYDELDAFYRDVWGEHVHHGLWKRGDETRAEAVRQLVAEIARAAKIGQGTRVCDIGCGYGETSRMLASEYRAHVTAMTVSLAQHAFAVARAEPGGNPDYRHGDWLANDLADASFDAAIAIESSEHMPSLQAFFGQARRVLKPGGRLVVTAWLSCDEPSRRQQRWLLEPICREGRMPQMGTVADYRRIGEAAGFCLGETQDFTAQVARTWPEIAWIFFGKLVRQPAYLRFLLDRHARNRVFALTIFRIWLAYRTGAMRYALFTFVAGAVDGKPLLPEAPVITDDAPLP